ncbi:MAG: DUF3301 domain-containing protein [Arenicella sp.]|nr:DUF3301 domain-containing protein [Arenicella sp.]
MLSCIICKTCYDCPCSSRGNVGVARGYEFEFTATGDRPYKGELWLHGKRLMQVELESHRI